ncbi:MAG: Gfo/Idh/MocA family oxidoreductase [Planctomycetota bacterium]
MSRPLQQSANRRRFLQSGTGAALAMSGVGFHGSTRLKASESPNERLQLLCVGVANRAAANLDGVNSQQLIGLCDVDANFLSAAAKKHPSAKTFGDYREMIDQLSGEADAIVVSTADHHHAPAALAGMNRGLHCYCEKPLTHTIEEARLMAKVATSKKLATQMGTQIHAGENYRRVVERIRSGVLGQIERVHVWVGKGWGGGERPETGDPVPKHLNWDQWIGPAPMRPYAKGRYHPAQWRRWWDFGQGTLGDMGCHYMDLPFWALGLRAPAKVVAEGPDVHPETCPLGLVVHYDFEASDSHGPLRMTWYDGDRSPKKLEGLRDDQVPSSGVLFVGSEGMMVATYGGYRLFPEEKFKESTEPARSIPRSIGHHAEWLEACRTGSPTTCNFDYSGALTECVLLGNVAYRLNQEILWDADQLRVTNAPAAERLIRKEYRDGWELPSELGE